ncbi:MULTISPECIES: class I SAM-dependent methyltransferase [Streptomyces]|uniref:Type 11 methyltransferase n=1 Tax=Streptomyces zinciresistens K42 TaxID=700597 RepID=G2G5Y7_9ACTN|nr:MULTISPECIES: class I SAM-dependent methyltransferase [Streptomyces]EGX61076.1 type 11 methyltransferase [Streptomyces zinciresistens K42]MDT9696600.1 class I SAM-dependent methyltransferase [Streptomyces sp. P17]
MSTATARRPKVRHPFFARVYPRINAFAEAHGSLDHRKELLAGTEGCVVEVGAGTGANFPHYPATVDKVIAVEPEPRLHKLALQAAAGSATPVEVRAGRAEELPVPAGSADGVVASLVLCSIADVPAALAEAVRVLRPGGRLYFYEHIRSTDPRFARKQRRINLVWPLLAGGCNLDRDTEQAIEDAGFTIEHARHFDFLVNGRTTPSSPCVIGVARKPEN